MAVRPLKSYTSRTGRKLKTIHAWNAWLLLGLAVSGIVLYLPALRGATAPVRVALKEGHIWAGLVSIALVLLYLPFLPKHAKRLRGKPAQTANLAIVLLLLLGWSASGVILWLERSMPPGATSFALRMHDWLTWIGVPYAIFHAVTRSRWVRERAAARSKEEEAAERSFDRYDGSRRALVKAGVAAAAALIAGPLAYRWLRRVGEPGGMTAAEVASRSASAGNGQELLVPLPESKPPIGGGAEGQFRIYTVAPIPKFDASAWKFTIDGFVDRPLSFDWKTFAELPRKVQVSDFHCVTGWSVYRATWEGIPLKELLASAGVGAGAKYVKFYSGDGVYTDALSLEQAEADDIMVAALIDGSPIPEDLGGPVRLIVPRMYAYKSVKWLERIELIDAGHIGYWQERGYDVDAWVPGAG
ncbi:molybdopterin-dependent oxidoreductase [Paenibacillus sp.]|uniref:molybdopterin-dependent oxidoreductase n=1 Tax=Paenibacillus sp. TaxID=58172 RepID=UPI002D6C565E|nr:molybdopterin-dependent oxidoreductase [Paenibacillus sp.]HZG88501.1 molybdopterin-dependent oxidoreductase [Paenibacillus sp.]